MESPKACSKASHAASGSHILGSVDSMNANVGVERRVDWVVPLYVMDCMATTMSRSMSWFRVKEAEFETNLEESYPPKMSCAYCPAFNPARNVSEASHVLSVRSYGILPQQ